MKRPDNLYRAALAFTRWIGSPQSVAIHSILFLATVALLFARVFSFDVVILIFNTTVSIEAIYLALFIQMTVNYTTDTIQGVEKDIDEIQEDVGEIQEDVGEIQKDVDEIQEDVDELQEDVEDIAEEEESEEQAEEARKAAQQKTLADIQSDLRKLMHDIEKLQNQPKT